MLACQLVAYSLLDMLKFVSLWQTKTLDPLLKVPRLQSTMRILPSTYWHLSRFGDARVGTNNFLLLYIHMHRFENPYIFEYK